MDTMEFLSEYRENNRIEAKRAQGGLPHSLWETYSAFANTLGGVILLGVAEAKPDGALYSVPLPDPEKLVEEFWTLVKDPAVVSANILQPEDVQIVRNRENFVVAIFVPRAPARYRPVYLGQDPYSGTYFRMGEGDCRAAYHEVQAMLQDQADLTGKCGDTTDKTED